MKSKSTSIIIAAIAICLFAAFTPAQTKHPNLTGIWKMNAEKSQFEKGGPDGIVIKFDHKDISLAESLMLMVGGGDRTLDLKYTTDGKESSQDVMGATGQTLAKWDGDSLLIEWKVENSSFNRKITLSADGKTMTMIVKQSNQDGQSATDTVILEKQETK